MTNLFESAARYLSNHWAGTGLLGLMTTAAVRTMPKPGTPFHTYTFLYDFLHQYFNIENTRLANATIPSVPSGANQNPTQPTENK